MSIEEEIFKRSIVNYLSLEPYGFHKDGGIYTYTKYFMNNMKCEVTIQNNKVSGKVIDVNTSFEYNNMRNLQGEYSLKVRNEYINILLDIKKNCFITKYFINDLANQVADFIYNFYNDIPQFLWDKYPGYGVFKNNNRWYAIIMNIDKSKLDKNKSGEVEIINVKLQNDMIRELLKKDGFYEAYHMNKKNWLSIILDGTVSYKEIIKYVKLSHEYTLIKA